MSRELQISQQNNSVFASAANFETAQRIANALSSSTLVPKEYQKNLPNTLIALEMAQRIGASPLMVMQHLYIVHGKPSWSSQFIIAALNSCGRFKPLSFEMTGTKGKDDRTCIAWTLEKGIVIPESVYTLMTEYRGKGVDISLFEALKKMGFPVLESPEVSIGISKAEGWYQKNGSKWQTMPELMLHYRSASFFGKLYAPEVFMGMQTSEEVRDIGSAVDITPSSTVDNLNAEFLDIKTDHNPETGEILEVPAEDAPTEEIPLHDRVNSMIASIEMDKELKGTAEYQNITETEEFRALWAEVKASGNKVLLGKISAEMSV